MAATFVDALIGYGFFLSRRGGASIQQINLHLERMGREPISPRTYGHYQGLLRHGFRSYIPINQFDVFRSLGRIQMAADRRRYSREATSLRIKVSADREAWIAASIIDKSLVGFGIRSLQEPRVDPGQLLYLRVPEHREFPAILVWKRLEGKVCRYGVRSMQFIANYLEEIERLPSPRAQRSITVRHVSRRHLTWHETYRMFARTEEVLNSASALVETVAEAARLQIQLLEPLLVRISFESPSETEIKVDFGVADIIKTVIEKVQFWGLEKRRYREETRGIELENANLQLEAIRSAIAIRKEAAATQLPEEVMAALGRAVASAVGLEKLPEGFFGAGTLETGIVADRLLPAATDLSAGDDPDVEVIVEDPRPAGL